MTQKKENRGRVQIAVSLDRFQYDWTQKRKGDKTCSPTFLLRKAIDERIRQEEDNLTSTNEELRNKIERISQTRQELLNFIEKHKLTEEWLNHDTAN